jgi:short-subunit dehydrogenase
MAKNYAGMTALITGASSGMGYEYALQLAGKGIHIIAVSNEKEKLEQMAQDFQQKFPVRFIAYYADLARESAAEDVYNFCIREKLSIDILINNAGFFFYKNAVDADVQLAKKKMLLHMVTPSLLCTLFARDMKERGSGYILNMSSISAWTPYPGISYYASTKRYIKSFSRALRSELKNEGVSVTCVLPGAVATNLFDRTKVNYDMAIRYGFMMHPDKVVKKALNAMFKRKASIIPGFLNKLMVFLIQPIPHGLIILFLRTQKKAA